MSSSTLPSPQPAPQQPSPQPVSESQRARTRALATALFCGAAMLVVFAFWLVAKHEDFPSVLAWLLGLFGLVAFGGGVWVLAAGGDEKTMQSQRRALSGGMLVGGLVLCGIALYVMFAFGQAGFGEAVGMSIVGVAALYGGLGLQRPAQHAEGNEHPAFTWLCQKQALVGLSLVAVGFVLALVALALLLFWKLDWSSFPELSAFMLLGLLGVSSGIWLTLSPSEQVTTAKMRIFVLIVGGVAGLILSLAALARAIVWRDDVFGGMRAWQGDNGYRVWVCAYVELLGLGLMFVCVLLARADIRAKPVLRRVLFGYNAVLTGLLLLAALVTINIVVYAMVPFAVEFSKSRGTHTLSDATKNLLNNLREPVTFFVLRDRNRIATELRTFLENATGQSTKVQVKYVDPETDAEYESLVKRFPDKLAGNASRGNQVDFGILLVYGDMPSDVSKKPPHEFITFGRLFDRDQQQSKDGETRGTLIFKGEGEIMTELNFLAQGRTQRKVYLLQGDGELKIDGAGDAFRRDLRQDLESFGSATLVELLKKDKYDVQGLELGEQLVKSKDKSPNVVSAKEVPADANAVIIAGPSSGFAAKTLDALESYMDRGGKLIVFLDIFLDRKETELKMTGLEDFLRKYGVQVGANFVIRYPQPVPGIQLSGDPRAVFALVPADTNNELAKQFQKELFGFRTVRVVRPDPTAKKYKAEPLLVLDRRLRQGYLDETNVRAITSPVEYINELRKKEALIPRLSLDPIPMAVAVSETQFAAGGKSSDKPRLVVIGDAECVSNFGIDQSEGLTYALTASALEWLSERQGLIGLRPKETNSYTINPQKVPVERMIFLPGWLMIVAIIALGGGIWLVRRR